MGCGLLAQLIGIDGNSGQLGRGQLAVEGIVEGDDGEISGDGQSGCGTGPFQNQSQKVIADNECGGPVFPAEQLPQGRIIRIDMLHFDAVFRPGRQSMEQHGKLPAGLTVCGVDMLFAFSQETDPPVSQIVQIVGGIPACQQIVIVNAWGGAGGILRLAHKNIGQRLFAQIIGNHIIFPGIQQNKSVDAAA